MLKSLQLSTKSLSVGEITTASMEVCISTASLATTPVMSVGGFVIHTALLMKRSRKSMKEKFNTKFERDRVPVMYQGEKVGMADVSRLGIISMSLTSTKLVNVFGKDITEHIDLVPKNKEK